MGHTGRSADIPIVAGSDEARSLLYRIIVGIRDDWNLSTTELAALLHAKKPTVNHWLRKQAIPLGLPPYSPNDESIIALLAIYRSLCQFSG